MDVFASEFVPGRASSTPSHASPKTKSGNKGKGNPPADKKSARQRSKPSAVSDASDSNRYNCKHHHCRGPLV